MKILNFASANVDYVYSVSHMVRPGETISAGKMEIFPGGKGLNQTVAAARAGANVYHAGFIGDDGDILLDILTQCDAKLDYLCRCDSKNGHAIIQVNDQAENSIVIYQGTNGMFSREYIDSVLDCFCADDIVMVQNEVNNLPYIIQRAYEKGMQIVLNPSPVDPDLVTLDLGCISYLVLNETEAATIFGTEDVNKILLCAKDQYPNMKIVLTLGSKGCVYAHGSTVITCPAFCVKPVDTTAAGDTFTGYFVAQIAAGRSVRNALRIACAAAALAVSVKGAAPSIPTMKQVNSHLESLIPYPAHQLKHLALEDRIAEILRKDPAGVTLDMLARELGYSSGYTAALVRNITGESYVQLAQRLRCQLAAELLKDSEMSISDVIQTVGYKNETHFRSVFRKQYGKNPLDYRKKGE